MVLRIVGSIVPSMTRVGHDTADCRQLKDQIEDLIRNGKLTEWVVREVRKHNTKSGGLGYHTAPPTSSSTRTPILRNKIESPEPGVSI